MEQGIEPQPTAYEAVVLPLYYSIKKPTPYQPRGIRPPYPGQCAFWTVCRGFTYIFDAYKPTVYDLRLTLLLFTCLLLNFELVQMVAIYSRMV